jgi:hypothetical protein
MVIFDMAMLVQHRKLILNVCRYSRRSFGICDHFDIECIKKMNHD